MDTIEFPAGVLQGRPFTNPDSALIWLAEASIAGSLDRIALLRGWDDPLLRQPVLYAEPVPLVDEGSWIFGNFETDRHGPESIRLYIETEANPSLAALPRDLVTDRPAHAVAWWRQLRGVEAAQRRSMPAAKSRAKVAQALAVTEASVQVAAVQVTALVNRWVSTIWADAVIAGLDVDPAGPQTPGATRAGLTLAGTVRSGLTA